MMTIRDEYLPHLIRHRCTVAPSMPVPGSQASSEAKVEASDEDGADSEVLSRKPLSRSHLPVSSDPRAEAASASSVIVSTSATLGADNDTNSSAQGVGTRSADRDSSDGGSSWADLESLPPAFEEIPRAPLERSSSMSSNSTATTAPGKGETWTAEDFQTPARGSGGIARGRRNKDHHAAVGAVGASGGSSASEGHPGSRRFSANSHGNVGLDTPSSIAATPGRGLVPDTPSPRSSMSTAGTPHVRDVLLQHCHDR